MKPEQFIRDWGYTEAKRIVDEAPESATRYEKTIDGDFYFKYENFNWLCFGDDQLIKTYMDDYETQHLIQIADLAKLVESIGRYNKFESKQEAIDAITNAPEGSTDYRKLSCGTRYIKQGPRFFEYWNGSEWCRPTVPFTDETHILRFDKLEDLKQSIKDHESIYGGGDEVN
ncbi:hypothetical protein [Acinetobacter baumannii]|uniref:hypothetical protein n=1 Tax=Acinetobacter baumannii TaxID=470 RepID=UPI00070E301D|nr:hypothetical protein [Acinetobacter baumannii]KRI30461.1 hypothetical protein APB98_11320 [Acinetobacter baumannii]